MPDPPPTVKTILLVEDDSDVRDALSQILRDRGYAVLGAADGREALEHLRRDGRVDLILLDLMMPVMDGWEFRRVQQQDAALAAIPVVILSADGNVRRKAASIAAAGYVQKPVETDQLLDLVRRHTGGPAP
jgi:CheY-like chemotaxis protein